VPAKVGWEGEVEAHHEEVQLASVLAEGVEAVGPLEGQAEEGEEGDPVASAEVQVHQQQAEIGEETDFDRIEVSDSNRRIKRTWKTEQATKASLLHQQYIFILMMGGGNTARQFIRPSRRALKIWE